MALAGNRGKAGTSNAGNQSKAKALKLWTLLLFLKRSQEQDPLTR